MAKPVPLLLLDIDGTVRQGKDDALGKFVNEPKDVVVFPEAVRQMRAWSGRILGVSNQGGVALGHLTIDAALSAMSETQRQCGDLFDDIRICVHAPGAGCWCRKPMPNLALHSIGVMELRHHEIYRRFTTMMVGDRPEDQQMAANMGVDFMWAAEWRAQAPDA